MLITKRRLSIAKATKNLDKVFSEYIRMRNADANGYVKCFTSGKIMHWKESQAGHYMSRRHMATRWDEQNVQVQSSSDNMFNQGNAPMFAYALDQKYGKGTAEKLLIKSRNFWKPTCFELELLTKEYQKKIDELSKVHG